MRQDPFSRKTYGRIFVPKDEEQDRVVGIIKELDEFEFSYMPKNLVDTWRVGTNRLVFLGKFEMCKTALTLACLRRGIWIWCVDGGDDELGFPP